MYFGKLPKIGLRTIKSALAVLVCLIIFPNEPFFACLTAVICLQDTVTNSITMAINRAVGTIIGSIVGLCFVYILNICHNLSNSTMERTLFLILVFIGIILSIYICTIIKLPGAVSITCIVFLAITTVHADGAPFYYGLIRTFETFIGIIVSLLINKFINPPKEDLNSENNL